LGEGARAHRGADVAIAPEPGNAAEVVGGISPGLRALGVSVDRCLVHHQQVRRQPEKRSVRLENQVFRCWNRGCERAEQLCVELVRQGHVERIGHPPAVFIDRNRIPKRGDLVGKLLRRRIQLDGARRGRRHQHCVDVLADDRHPVIRFARPQDFLQVGQRDRVA